MKKLIEAYEEYIALLVDQEQCLARIAYVHGWRCPAALVKRGEELRAKIAKLKEKVQRR